MNFEKIATASTCKWVSSHGLLVGLFATLQWFLIALSICRLPQIYTVGNTTCIGGAKVSQSLWGVFSVELPSLNPSPLLVFLSANRCDSRNQTTRSPNHHEISGERSFSWRMLINNIDDWTITPCRPCRGKVSFTSWGWWLTGSNMTTNPSKGCSDGWFAESFKTL